MAKIINATKNKVNLPFKDKIVEEDIQVVFEGESGKPIVVDSLDESLLVEENIGKVYSYNNELYQLEKVTSLKGLTIKLNEQIEDCPAIGEDDEIECSAVLYDGSDMIMTDAGKAIYKLRKRFFSNGPAFYFAFNAHGFIRDEGELYEGYYADCFYDPAGNCWCITDENGNTVETSNIVFYNFDCPTLNENPEFIKWVFENAKVYPNFRSSNDIESFKLDNTNMFRKDWICIGYSLQDAFRRVMWDANRTGAVLEFDVDGQYTASFLVNGELVHKTFTNVNVDSSASLPIFSDETDELIFLFATRFDNGEIFDKNGELIPSPVKYNDVYVTDITFTKFDCTHNNKIDSILSFILCYTAVSGNYVNGFKLKKYDEPLKKYDGKLEVK